MPSEKSLEVLRNYISKYENSTEPNHVAIVAFARKRLAEGLAPPTAYSKWDDTTVSSAGRLSPNGSTDPLFTDDESSYTRYTGYSSLYSAPEPKTSIFATVCKNLAWKGYASMIHRARIVE